MILTPRSLLALAAAAMFTLAAQAQMKIATLNYTNVFFGYWKTKQANIQLEDRAKDFDKARKGMVDDYTKANEDYRKLIDSANDQAVSADERDKRKKSAESKLLELKEIEQSITQFDRQARQTLGDQKRRMQDNLSREIRELISNRARIGSYNLVLDTSAVSLSEVPIVLYTSGTPDLTEEIVNQLNATAPAGALNAPEKTDDKGKKDEKK